MTAPRRAAGLVLRWAALALVWALSLALSACANLTAPALPRAAVLPDPACARWFAQLDEAIHSAGVHDAEAESIAGFAGLRTDRVGTALRSRAAASAAAFEAWLAR